MKTTSHQQRWLKRLGLTLIAVLIIAGASVVIVRRVYNSNLNPVSANQASITVNIPLGSSLGEIAKIFKDKKVIKSEWAFKQYVRNKGADSDIKAGVYELSPSYSVPEIVSIITQGKIKTNLVTILPGQTIKQIKQTLIKHGFDKNEVEKAFNPKVYKDHPALVDKPANADLEGYLYPESYQKNNSTTVEQLVTLALDEMQDRLTPDLRKDLARQDLSVYEGIIVASIVEKEVDKPTDRTQAAQVFLKRLREGMVLGSDVTAFYGAAKAGQKLSLGFDSGYNTHLHRGLPVGPISNVSEDSLQAVAHPAKTSWLYFVAGDDGITYFSRTLAEHHRLVEKHCKKLCAAP